MNAKSLIKILAAIAAAIVALMLIRLAWQRAPTNMGERLYGATVSRDYAKMQLLLNEGADVDFLFDSTTSCIEVAIENDDPKAVAILLSHNASIRTLSGHYERKLRSMAFSKEVQAELKSMSNQDKWPTFER